MLQNRLSSAPDTAHLILGLAAAPAVQGRGHGLVEAAQVAALADQAVGEDALCRFGEDGGGAAAGIGSMLYDMLDPSYIAECWMTFLMKGAYGVVAGLIAGKNWGYGKAMAGTVAGAATYAVLYLLKTYFYTGLFEYGLTPDAAMVNVIGKLLPTGFNAAVAIVAAPLLAVTIRKALEHNRISLN